MSRLLADLAHKRYRNVVVLAGAGISTAAGIPDFRSPRTGLYANLQRFKLPYPEAVFDIDYLRKNPDPFFMLAREMYPSNFSPTSFHRFIKWISDLGCLKRVYTQNIDTLERRAGVPADLIVEAHGSFSSNACIDCKRKAPNADVEKAILHDHKVPRCAACDGIVKPDIVFFGEGLPERFFDLIETDFDDVDLAIVAGTSLQVGPFNQLPDLVPRSAPRYLLNMERAGSLGRRKHDVLILGPLEDLDLDFTTEESVESGSQSGSLDQKDRTDQKPKTGEKGKPDAKQTRHEELSSEAPKDQQSKGQAPKDEKDQASKDEKDQTPEDQKDQKSKDEKDQAPKDQKDRQAEDLDLNLGKLHI